MKFKILLTASIAILLTSCKTPTTVQYDIELVSVESIDAIDNGKISKIDFKDNELNITLLASSSHISFELTNKTNNPMKLIWDEVAIVDVNGYACKVHCSSIKETHIPMAIIPKGAKISDIITPSNNTVINKYNNTIERKKLVPVAYESMKEKKLHAHKYIGKTISVYIPLLINGKQKDYTFTFLIKDLKEEEKKKPREVSPYEDIYL